MTIKKSRLLLLLLAVVWPLGQLLELPFPLPGAHLYALDILAAASLLYSLSQFSKIKKLPLYQPLLVFLSAATLSLLAQISFLPSQQFLLAFLYLARIISYSSFYFTLTLNKQSLSPRAFVSVLLVFILLGLGQYLFLPDTRFLMYYGFDDHYFRLIGTLLDPNFTGAVLAVSVFLLLGFLPGYYKTLTLLPLTSLAFTFSRSSYLSFFIAFLVFLLSEFKKKYLLLLLALPLFILLAPKPFGEGVNLTRTFSLHSRWQTLSQTLPAIKEHPLLGVGFNTLKSPGSAFPYPDRATGSLPNSYLFVLLTTGFVGLFAFFNFIYKAFNSLQSSYLRSALIVLLVHGLFNNTLFYSWTLTLFFLILALYRE